MKKIFLIISLIIAGVLVWCIVNNKPLNKKTEKPEMVLCAQDAKQCSDGSYVGRTGPKCEFVCPKEQPSEQVGEEVVEQTNGQVDEPKDEQVNDQEQIKEEDTAVLNQKILNQGIYITPLQIISDSRCPIDVQCIWAGEILVKVKLEKGEVSKEVELKERGSVVFEGKNVSLLSVTPAKETKNPVPQEDYQFTFKVASVAITGTISGSVNIGPTCPVERIPPDPKCAPKAYPTSINITKSENTEIIKTIQTDQNGTFNVELDSGTYVLQAQGGNILPRCPEVSVEVKAGQDTNTEISCDSGIR